VTSSDRPSLADRIDALLPQTQCTKCGYDGCRPYAEAIAADAASINQCPPGGTAGIEKLAALTGKPALTLNPANGAETLLRVAVIDEPRCIGCTLCIQACPVDAIVGAARRMHVVIDAWCTGCDLCVAPCPVDCIAMIDVAPLRAWSDADAQAARMRHDARRDRLATIDVTSVQAASAPADTRQAAVQAAIARARARRQAGAHR